MRIAITGADGFVGKHATRVFRERGHEVVELVGGEAVDPKKKIELRDSATVDAALRGSEATHVLHLAGASSVARSHENPAEAFEVNALGTVRVLEVVRRALRKARVVVVSSGEVYGNLDHAARESEPTNPTSPYAASKLAAEIAAKQFQASYGVDVVVARPFNHLGPGQAPHFVVPSFARQLREIRRAGNGELRVGNLEAERDFSHVLDVVDAYEILLERGASGETYNIGSGEPRSIRSLLDELIALACVNVTPLADPTRMRPIELPRLVGDPAKVRALGWLPKRTVTDALGAALREA